MLKDPQLAFQKAVYSTLTTPTITVQGQAIPVYEFPPATAQPPFVLFKQPTVVPLIEGAYCKTWECTALLDIVTTFPAVNQASSVLASLIAEDVLDRLLDKRLSFLHPDFGMSRMRLTMSETRTDNASKEFFDVHRYLRVSTMLEQYYPANLLTSSNAIIGEFITDTI